MRGEDGENQEAGGSSERGEEINARRIIPKTEYEEEDVKMTDWPQNDGLPLSEV